MNRTIKTIIVAILAVLVLAVVKNSAGNPNRSVAGIRDPIQKKASGEVKTTAAGYDVTISFKFSYDIEALVVHTKNYYGSSFTNDLSPKDLALAWGEPAGKNGDVNFHWSQSGRWYHWSLNADDASKISIDSINCHSANNHIIPADDMVKKQLKKIKAGDHIRITGYLVDIRGEKDNGDWYTWNSSESRNDTGDGACEVIYASKIEILN
ncbi:MAG: hypothetical protein MJ125_05720 [Clostridia bacterium]|nr:hypothetical protein [Clostridia bacterium]